MHEGWGGVGEGTGLCTHRIHVLWAPRVPAAAFFLLPSTPGLMEMRAVALRTVAIKGVHSGRYLCMGADGRMQGLVGVSAGGTSACPRAGPRRGGGRAGSSPGSPRFLRGVRRGSSGGKTARGQMKLKCGGVSTQVYGWWPEKG